VGLFDAYNYKGKRTVVVGGATGMGAAVAELVLDAGAEVVVMDRAEVKLDGVKAVSLDLANKASIEAAVAECGGPVHALFSCAGVADGTPGLEKINFIGHRYLIDGLLAGGYLPRGSAIGFISSAAGLGWEGSLPELLEYLAITDFDEASQWAQDRGKADYMWSKKTINAYVAQEAFSLLTQGIRINAILPGPTDTPLADASTPLQQAYPLVFLCSDAAAGVTGITMVTDAGYFAAGVTGSFPPAKDVIGFLRSI
jgi:NAD(P)-dependent dehydrogenase (short-subunit alcohol dehydrogenase family)